MNKYKNKNKLKNIILPLNAGFSIGRKIRREKVALQCRNACILACNSLLP
jgi:hypothetical protein